MSSHQGDIRDTSTIHRKKSFLILPDSLSSLQNVNYDHPSLVKNHELHSKLIQDGKETFRLAPWPP